MEFLVFFSLCPLHFFLSLGTTEKSLAQSALCLPIGVYTHRSDSYEPSLLSTRLDSQTLLRCSILCLDVPDPPSSRCLIAGLTPVHPCCQNWAQPSAPAHYLSREARSLFLVSSTLPSGLFCARHGSSCPCPSSKQTWGRFNSSVPAVSP